jgi:uncharacterized protein (DUF433 family)
MSAQAGNPTTGRACVSGMRATVRSLAYDTDDQR